MSVIAKQFCREKPKDSSVYLTSEQILPFGFSGQDCDPYTFNSLDLFHDTRFVQAHLIVYYSGGQMLAALAQNYTSLRPLGLQYRIGVCRPAVYMYTCTINGGDLSAVDIVYGWKVEAMFFLGSNTINPIFSI